MKLKPMQIMITIAIGSLLIWIAKRVMQFYAPNAKGTGIYYAFALFLIFSMGILDINDPTILAEVKPNVPLE
jgi:hypothetical protein